MSEIRLNLNSEEALVLLEFLSRFSEKEELIIKDPSEQRVLWDLQCLLEAKLVETLSDDYAFLLKKS